MRSVEHVQNEFQGRSPDRVRLVAVNDRWGIQAVEVTASQFLVGRSPGCHLQLGSPLISRMHLMIEKREGRTFVRDLESTNGTVLNGRTFFNREIEADDGDLLTFGPFLFTIQIDRSPESPSSTIDGAACRCVSDSPAGFPSLAPAADPSYNGAHSVGAGAMEAHISVDIPSMWAS